MDKRRLLYKARKYAAMVTLAMIILTIIQFLVFIQSASVTTTIITLLENDYIKNDKLDKFTDGMTVDEKINELTVKVKTEGFNVLLSIILVSIAAFMLRNEIYVILTW